MHRDEVLHVARAAAAIAGVRRVLVVGSQAILGAYDEAQLPEEALTSIEADIVIIDDPSGAAATEVDANIGYMSLFHTTNGYYADGVELSELTLPAHWQSRCLKLDAETAAGDPMEVYFLAVADLCAAKLGAARSQDRRFVQALVDHRLPSGRPLVDLDEVDSAAATLSDNEGARTRALQLVDVLRRGGAITHPNLPT